MLCMDRLERILTMLDRVLSSKKKRHLAGGILLSVSLLFGGLSFTVMTLKHDENEKENKDEQRFIE